MVTTCRQHETTVSNRAAVMMVWPVDGPGNEGKEGHDSVFLGDEDEDGIRVEGGNGSDDRLFGRPTCLAMPWVWGLSQLFLLAECRGQASRGKESDGSAPLVWSGSLDP